MLQNSSARRKPMGERIIKLGLTQARHSGDAPVVLAWLLDRLLALISEVPLEAADVRTKEFRSQLELYRARITGADAEAGSRESLEATAQACLATCDRYFKQVRVFQTERETEFGEVIDILRKAVAEVAGEANTFHTRLLSASERFTRLSEIEDIRELKKQIAQEVSCLQNLVAEKRKQDEALCSRLSQTIEGLHSELNQVREEATLDPLTGVSNRGSFDRVLRHWVKAYGENKKSFVLAMMDVDDFKRLNDSHGHQVGDRVLVTLMEQFSGWLRDTDFLGRYGGDEFVLLMGNARLADVKPRLSDLLEKVCAPGYQYGEGEQACLVRFTVTCGLAEFTPGQSPEDVIRQADEALYEGKRRGKNRVMTKRKPFLKTLAEFIPAPLSAQQNTNC